MAHERKEKNTLTKSHDIGSHVSESMILSLIYQMKWIEYKKKRTHERKEYNCCSKAEWNAF